MGRFPKTLYDFSVPVRVSPITPTEPMPLLCETGDHRAVEGLSFFARLTELPNRSTQPDEACVDAFSGRPLRMTETVGLW
jgi:hypothetical protein